jgi:CubicO group peptidase (beta-lactamase class C family)
MKKSGTISKIVFFMALLLLSACRNAMDVRTVNSLVRSYPEAEGVSTESIISFIKAIEDSQHEFHSFMFLRHGKVIAEGWWDPYKPELKHTLYSTSKSFTSTAVGFAVTENRIRVSDKVVSFFPEYLPESVSPNLGDMEIRDLLTMSAGQIPDPTHSLTLSETNWIRGFLALPVVNDPGTKFLYNSMATYMLSAIVQKVTGEKIIDYLTPRLFEPLGISGMDWETDPAGINTGGWGLRLKTEDMAKFGQLYLNKGEWNGKQILPSLWIEEATSFKIDQMPGAEQAERDSSDWVQGYCYQFWRSRHNAYRADGAYGQYIIVMPDQDAVVAITSETSDMQKEINLVWKYLLPGIKEKKLPENPEAYETLKSMLSGLKLSPGDTKPGPPVAAVITGRKYSFAPNAWNLESISFSFSDYVCNVMLTEGNTDYPYNFGNGKWIAGETLRMGPNLLRNAQSHFKGLPPPKTACSYTWRDENTLDLILRYIESPHTETYTCHFEGDSIEVALKISSSFGAEPSILKGVAKK